MYFRPDNCDALYRQNDKPIRSIEKAMNERNQTLEIQQDEIKYSHQFVHIYNLLTGNNPQPQITEECPTLYLNGLKFAIQDEQLSVDFYLVIHKCFVIVHKLVIDSLFLHIEGQ